MRSVRAAVRQFADAAMFDLFDRGHTSLFEQLVACIISIRTRDEVSLPAALHLFAVARTPVTVSRLALAEIEALIRPSTKGVGPKCAHLALGIACGQAKIAVDVHVHRVTNRWGIVCTGVRPRCSTCPVLEYCRQVGVTEHR